MSHNKNEALIFPYILPLPNLKEFMLACPNQAVVAFPWFILLLGKALASIAFFTRVIKSLRMIASKDKSL